MSKARFAYNVIEVRDSLFKGGQSGSKLGEIINEQAAGGWRLVQVIKEDISTMSNIKSKSGVLLVFEYEYTDADYAPAVDADSVVG